MRVHSLSLEEGLFASVVMTSCSRKARSSLRVLPVKCKITLVSRAFFLPSTTSTSPCLISSSFHHFMDLAMQKLLHETGHEVSHAIVAGSLAAWRMALGTSERAPGAPARPSDMRVGSIENVCNKFSAKIR